MVAKNCDKRNIKYGIVLSYLNLIVSIIGTLLVTNRVVKLVGEYNYGLYSFVNSITAWLTVLSSALNASFVRFSTIEAKENDGDSSKINTIYLKLFMLIGIVVLVAGLVLTGALYFAHINIGNYGWSDSEYLYLLFALSIINIAITIPSTLYTLYISYKKKFIFGKLLTVFTSVANYIGHFLLAYYYKDVTSICIFSIAITIVTFAINLFYAKKSLKCKLGKAPLFENKILLKSIVVFSGILVLNAIVDQVNQSVDKTLLGFFSVPEDVTYYQLGQNFDTYLMTVSLSISSLFIPTINELVVNKKQQEINELYLKVSHAQTFAVSIVAFGFIACGLNFVNWWLGEGNDWVYYVGAILMLIDICPLTLNSSIEIQRAENKHLFRALVYLGVAILNVGLSILFLFVFPAEYKILACLVGSFIARIISHWIAINIYNKKSIKLPVGKYMLNVLKYLGIGVIGCLVSFLTNHFVFGQIESYFLKTIFDGVIFIFIFCICAMILDFEFFKKALCKILGVKLYNKTEIFFSTIKIFFKQQIKNSTKKNNQKPKFLFIIQRTETFSSVRTIFEFLLKAEAEVYLLPLPRYNQNKKKFDFETYQKNFEFCKQRIPKDHILKSIDADNCFIDYLHMDFDFVFINTPYQVAYPKLYNFKRIAKYSKLCFVPYGGALIINNHSIYQTEANDIILSSVDYAFADSETMFAFMKKKMKLCERKRKIVYYLGFPRFDLATQKKVKNINTILWLPRWTTPNFKSQEPSSFLKLYKQIFDYAERHKNINIIIRPHPLMFDTFIKEGFLSEEEYNLIIEKIKQSRNLALDENPAYLDSLNVADVLLADFTSIILEFFATTKPIIYLGNVDKIDENYSDIVSTFYNLAEWDAINRQLDELIEGFDWKFEDRVSALKKHKSDFGDGKIGETIAKFLIDEWSKTKIEKRGK